jgi:hypothetical protein
MKELMEKYVGKKGYVYLEGLKVEVRVLDVKSSYGKQRFLIKPMAGEGQVWKEQVTLMD